MGAGLRRSLRGGGIKKNKRVIKNTKKVVKKTGKFFKSWVQRCPKIKKPRGYFASQVLMVIRNFIKGFCFPRK